MDDVSLWALISAVAPIKLHGVWIMIAAITKAMWLINEQAIRDFRSVCRKQIELVIIIPHRDNMMKGQAIVLVMGYNRIEIRIIQYPPSLSRIAAMTIDPAIGASMCALGSHR